MVLATIILDIFVVVMGLKLIKVGFKFASEAIRTLEDRGVDKIRSYNKRYLDEEDDEDDVEVMYEVK